MDSNGKIPLSVNLRDCCSGGLEGAPATEAESESSLEESGLATNHPEDASDLRTGNVVVPEGQEDASGGIPDEHVGDAVT
jgi:hypothetical protein